MSTCISRHGEFSEHETGRDSADRFTCQRCHVFDEDAALQRIAELEAAQASDTTDQTPAISAEMIEAAAGEMAGWQAPWSSIPEHVRPLWRGKARAALSAALAGRTVVDRPVLAEIDTERVRQDAQWGEQNHPDLYPPADHGLVQQHYANEADGWKWLNAERVAEQNELGTPSDRNAAWDGVLLEEVYEALAEANPVQRRTELIQVAAVATAWVEAIDRRLASESSGDGETCEECETAGYNCALHSGPEWRAESGQDGEPNG